MDLAEIKKMLDEQNPKVWQSMTQTDIYRMRDTVSNNWAFQFSISSFAQKAALFFIGLPFFVLIYKFAIYFALIPIVTYLGDGWMFSVLALTLIFSFVISFVTAAMLVEAFRYFALESQARPDVALLLLSRVSENSTNSEEYEDMVNNPYVKDYIYNLSVNRRKYLNIDILIMEKLVGMQNLTQKVRT